MINGSVYLGSHLYRHFETSEAIQKRLTVTSPVEQKNPTGEGTSCEGKVLVTGGMTHLNGIDEHRVIRLACYRQLSNVIIK